MLCGGTKKTRVIPDFSDINKNHRRVPCGQSLDILCAETIGGVD